MPFKQSVEPAACLNVKTATAVESIDTTRKVFPIQQQKPIWLCRENIVAAEDVYGSQQKTLCRSGKNNQMRVKLNF